MNAKKNLLLAVLFFLAVAAIGCTQPASPPPQNGETAIVSLQYTDANGSVLLEKSFTVQRGANAFEALKQNADLNYQTFSFGIMVQAINQIAPPEGYYLALYVDGTYAEKGIADYTITNDTAIEWKTEKIDNFNE